MPDWGHTDKKVRKKFKATKTDWENRVIHLSQGIPGFSARKKAGNKHASTRNSRKNARKKAEHAAERVKEEAGLRRAVPRWQRADSLFKRKSRISILYAIIIFLSHKILPKKLDIIV